MDGKKKSLNPLIPIGGLVVLFVILAAVAGDRLRSVPEDASSGPSTDGEGFEVGQEAPDFTLPTLDGQTVQLSALRGEAVMIDFWAAWCPFCRSEFPAMDTAYRRYKDQGFIILGIHRTATESRKAAEEFIETTGVTFPILLDESDEHYAGYSGVPAMPMSVFIDRDGIIRDKIFGPKDLDTLEDEIADIL